MNINTDIIKIEAIIVIYNKEIEMSVTYNDISNIKDENIEVCIIDNSTEKNNNLLYCNKNKIKYFSMNGNKGLSKAYNKAIDNLGDSDVVVLFDDDTEINKKYFKELRNCVINYKK